MKKPCDIVQDLLPLHLDGMLKPESEEFVKEHLYSCPHCKSLKNELWKGHIWKRDQSIAQVQPVPHGGEQELVKRIRSWKRRTSLIGILLLCLISLLSWFIGRTFPEDNPQPVIKPAVEKQTSMIAGPNEI